MSAVPVAVRRIRRRVLAKDIRSGSRSAAAEACAISALIAWWTIRYAQISWWARSGSRERSTLPGPRRWGLSWSLLVASCRVGPPHCCGGPPSEPGVRFVSAQGTTAILLGEQAGVVAVEGGFDLASSGDPVVAQVGVIGGCPVRY